MENERHIKVEETEVETERIAIPKKEYESFMLEYNSLKERCGYLQTTNSNLYNERYELRKQLEETQKENEELKNGILYYVRKLGGK